MLLSIIGNATLFPISPSDNAVHNKAPARIFVAIIIYFLSSD
jgi:hypothetical protein